MSSPNATPHQPARLTPLEVADRLRTIDLRAGYIIGACKDTREMRLEAEEIKRLVDETFKGLRAWWHGDMAQSATEQPNAAPQGGLANAGDHDSGVSDDASVMGAAPASAAPSGTPKTDTFYYDKRGEVPILRERSETPMADAIVDTYLDKCDRVFPDGSTSEDIERNLREPIRKLERELAEANKRDSSNFARMVEQGLRADRAEEALRIAQSAINASNPSATAPTSGEISTAHVYRDACGDMRIAIRYADATEEDRPATSFEVAVSAKISEIAASLQASHLPQNEKHG